MCFRAAAGALVSQVKKSARRARATASARALDKASLNVLNHELLNMNYKDYVHEFWYVNS